MSRLSHCLLLLLMSSLSSYALTTCRVSIFSDDNPGGQGNPGDLRYCINSMNISLNTSPDDYQIVFEAPATINLNGILPIINNSTSVVNITIGNPIGGAPVTLDGQNAYSGLFIPQGNVTIQNMIFQNFLAQGGNGGDGISGGGGGMGAGAAIYMPEIFLNGSYPSLTLIGVQTNTTSAVGGRGGNAITSGVTGNEGGGGGGGFAGDGGSITTRGITGGGGGGGFGGQGGDVTLSTTFSGGGGGGGGGIGAKASMGTISNSGNGGADIQPGSAGNAYGLTLAAGSGGSGDPGGARAGGGGGGGTGGGGGGSTGTDGQKAFGNIVLPKYLSAAASGGQGADGGGGGGGAIVQYGTTNYIDAQGAQGGYAGGGGGAAGPGFSGTGYFAQGGTGGLGGGGGGGGVNRTGPIISSGGNSYGGGGGGGGGPGGGGGGVSYALGGGAGGDASSSYGEGGGGGGGGSALGGAIFVDSNLTLNISAASGIPTNFQTLSSSVAAGSGGSGGTNASDGQVGSALGQSIFLRSNSALHLVSENAADLLTIGDSVDFTDDTNFGGSGTAIFVLGHGTVIYQGSTYYQGSFTINSANFKVNGNIYQAPIRVCRAINEQRGTLSGHGAVNGDVFVNSGIIAPDTGSTLTLGTLTLNEATVNSLGSQVHIEIDASAQSSINVQGAANLAANLELKIDPSVQSGTYTLLTANAIIGQFSSVTFTDKTPANYTISYLPVGAPTSVQLSFTSVDIPATVNGSALINPAQVCCGRPVLLGPLPVPGSGPTEYSIIEQTGSVHCQIKEIDSQTILKMYGRPGSCTIIASKDGVISNPLVITVP